MQRLFPMACSTCFPIEPRTTSLEVAPPIVEWALPHQSLGKKVPYRLPTTGSYGACVKLTKKTSQHMSCLLQLLFTFVFWASVLLKLESTSPTRLAGQWAPGIHLSSPHPCQDWGLQIHTKSKHINIFKRFVQQIHYDIFKKTQHSKITETNT